MYEEFFGLTCRPFQITPDPDFLYLSKTHQKAMNYLSYGIQENTGFIVVTGEIGSGKTTLVRRMLRILPENVRLARINNTRVDSASLLAMISDEFGYTTTGKTKSELFRELNDFLIEEYAQGRHCVLIIDEAQNLSIDLIEEVRLLSNLETDKAKLLQIILVGQPELRDLLSQPELEQFAQRVTITCHVRSLAQEETEEYITHRLSVAGNANAVIFEPGVVDEIHNFSGGIPRLINVICEWVLLSAFSDGTRRVSLEMIRDITREITADQIGGPRRLKTEAARKTADSGEQSADVAVMKNRLERIETVVGGIGLALLERLLDVSDKKYSTVEAVENLKEGIRELMARAE